MTDEERDIIRACEKMLNELISINTQIPTANFWFSAMMAYCAKIHKVNGYGVNAYLETMHDHIEFYKNNWESLNVVPTNQEQGSAE